MSSRGTVALVLATVLAGVGAPIADAAPTGTSTGIPQLLTPVPPTHLQATPTPTTTTTGTTATPAPATPPAPLPYTGMNVELELGLAAALVGGGIAVAAVGRTRRR
ncbi:MAG TPA: hypothetical protein VG223_12860 [Solirubrobacteraceae bacterium]|nr:hypothetical protein [Solirubrobacteraceae bacterium]